MGRKGTKIIHWSFLYFPLLGGISTHIDSIVNNMPEYEHEVVTNHIPNTKTTDRYSENTVIKRFKPSDYTFYPPKWMKRRYSIPYGVYSEIIRTLKQKKYFKNTDFDLLHVHETDKNLYSLDIALNTHIFSKWSHRLYDLRKIKKPKVLTKHFMFAEGYMHPKLEEWEKHSFDGFDNIIFPTRAGYQKYLRYFEAINQKKNVLYIPNSVDTDILKFAPLTNHPKLRIGCVARLSLEKGEDFLIEFLKNLPAYVDFYWACSGGEERIANLKKVIRKPNIRIYLNLGYEKIPEFYHNFDVLLNTTMIIANDRVIPEAMSCGRPVIAIDVGESCHVINGKTGYLIPPDVKELLSLITYINEDRNKLKNMGRNARELVESKFSNKVLIPKIKKVYDTIT